MVTAPLIHNTEQHTISISHSPLRPMPSRVSALSLSDDSLLLSDSSELIHVRKDAAHRTLFFTFRGESVSLTDAPLIEWIAFLQNVGYDINAYSESPVAPHLKRCDVINELIRAGNIHVNTEVSPYPWQKPLMLLEPCKVIVGCSELAREDRWNTSLCCERCHASNDLIKVILADQREAWVCCIAEKLMEDYGPGKMYGELPGHEE